MRWTDGRTDGRMDGSKPVVGKGCFVAKMTPSSLNCCTNTYLERNGDVVLNVGDI